MKLSQRRLPHETPGQFLSPQAAQGFHRRGGRDFSGGESAAVNQPRPWGGGRSDACFHRAGRDRLWIGRPSPL